MFQFFRRIPKRFRPYQTPRGFMWQLPVKILNLAAARGNIPMASMLLAHMGPNQGINSAEDMGYMERLGDTPLISAIKRGKVEMGKFLIERGANVNLEVPEQRTPLNRAIFNEDTEFVKLLLKNGADVHSTHGKKKYHYFNHNEKSKKCKKYRMMIWSIFLMK